MSFLAVQGAALFLFIPVVLILYLRQPLGPAVSLALGVGIMLGHRFIAAPWMGRHSQRRCLWCGRTGDLPERFAVAASGRDWPMAACGAAHRSRASRFLQFAEKFRPLLAAGIFIPLLLLLLGTLAIAIGRAFLAHETNVLIFRTVVATTVVGASVGWRAMPQPAPGARIASPFPLHNLFLLGIGNTLWVFRVVGLFWLASSAAAVFGGGAASAAASAP